MVDLAAVKAQELNEQYSRNWPVARKDSRTEGDGLIAKAFILRELDACERRLRGTRTQAEALGEEGVR